MGHIIVFKLKKKKLFLLHHFFKMQLIVLSVDLDECSEIRGLCRNGRCTNTDGSYQCTCFDGFQLSRNADNCEGRLTAHLP